MSRRKHDRTKSMVAAEKNASKDEAGVRASAAKPAASVKAVTTSGADSTIPASPAMGMSGSGARAALVPSYHAHDGIPVPLRPRDPDRYQILAEHGRGGLGRVYRAHDRELGRDVALKELIRPSYQSELRFIREARITARLEHPNIVPVHEAGRWPDGTPFYSMKLVAGRPLSELLLEAKTLDQRLALVPHLIAVADAIAYAHDRLVIHRDLKPSNVIIGEFGETIVIDWGLAKDLAEGAENDGSHGPYRTSLVPDVTVTGSVLGTPAYMSPEQARGDPADTRSDIYSLGAMLFQLCTGTAPPTNAMATDRRKDLGRVPEDLATIVLKALSSTPDERYPDVAAFASDLRAYDTGARIAARNYSLVAMLRHWIRRHKRIAISFAIPMCVAIAVGVLSLREILLQRDRASNAKLDAEAARAVADKERNAVLLTHASESLGTDPTTAVAWLKKLPKSPALEHVRRNIAIDAASRGVARTVLDYSPLMVNQVAISDDGKTLVAATRDGVFRRFEMPGLTLVAETKAHVDCDVAITSDGGIVALGQENGSVKLWYRDGREIEVLGHAMLPYAISFSADGRFLYTSGPDAEVRVVDVEARRSLLLYRHADVIRSIAVSPSGDRIATASDDGKVVVFELALGRAVRLNLLGGKQVGATAVRFLRDGRIVSGHRNGMLVFWSADGRVVRQIKVHNGGVDHIRIAANSSFVLSIGTDRTVARTSVADFSVEAIGTHDKTITNSFLGRIASRSIFVATFADGSIRYWDLEGRVSRVLKGHRSHVSAAIVSADEHGEPLIVSAGLDGTLRLWPIPAPISHTSHRHEWGTLSIAASPDGNHFATGGRDGRIVLATSTGVVAELRDDADLVYNVAFSPAGDRIASASFPRNVTIWDVARRERIASRKIPEELPGNFIFHGEGRVLLVAADTVFEWDYQRDSLRVVRKYGEQVQYIAGRRPIGPYFVLTQSGRTHQLDIESSRSTELATDVVDLYEDGHVVAVPHADRSTVRVTHLVSNIEYAPVPLGFEVDTSILDANRRTLFAFDREGRGAAWSLADREIAYLRSPNGDTRRLALLPGGAVMRVAENGALERWDFRSQEIIAVREQENSTGILTVLRGGRSLVTADSDGKVFIWPLDALERRWARLRDTAPETLTDFEIQRPYEW